MSDVPPLFFLQVRREVKQVSAANLNALLRTTDTATAARSAGDPASPASRGDTLVTYEDFTTIRFVRAPITHLLSRPNKVSIKRCRACHYLALCAGLLGQGSH